MALVPKKKKPHLAPQFLSYVSDASESWKGDIPVTGTQHSRGDLGVDNSRNDICRSSQHHGLSSNFGSRYFGNDGVTNRTEGSGEGKIDEHHQCADTIRDVGALR